ncbi:MAG: CBS domain-containing protein [Pseudomonadota bacterium]
MPITGTVGAHMRPLAEYPQIDADATLGDVFAMIGQHFDAVAHFRSVLVFNREKRLIGKISLHDLLKVLLPDYLAHLPAHIDGTDGDHSLLALLWQDDSAKYVREVAKQRVGDHIQPAPAPLKPDDPLTLAHYRFAHSDLNTLPVAENGRIVGVLRVVDVLAAVAATIHPA